MSKGFNEIIAFIEQVKEKIRRMKKEKGEMEIKTYT